MSPSILFSIFILLIVLILCLIILISKSFYIQGELEHLSDLIEGFEKKKTHLPPSPLPKINPKEVEPQHPAASIRFATFPCPSCDYVHVINEQDLPVRRDCPNCGQTVEVDP